MKNINTILFDLDGTLIDTNNIIIESFKHTFKTHFPDLNLDLDTIKSFIGPPLQKSFSAYTDDLFKIQDMIKTYRSFYVDYESDNHKLYPNVKEVLLQLKEKGYNLGVVTSKTNDAAWPSYTHYDFDQLFDVFVGLDDVEHPKPHRNPVDVALQRLEDVKGAIMIGDNQSDILTGKNAGIYSAGVAWSLKGSYHLMEVEPDFMLGDMDDIFSIIQKIEED
jgi:pyrophosphatase PpaX